MTEGLQQIPVSVAILEQMVGGAGSMEGEVTKVVGLAQIHSDEGRESVDED
jgi:hypothetical protein